MEWRGIKKYCFDENLLRLYDSSGWKDFRRPLAENRVSWSDSLLRTLSSLDTLL